MNDPKYWKKNVNPVSFKNPLEREISIDQFNPQNRIVTTVFAPLKTYTMPKYKADYFIKHITDAVINDRQMGYLTPEARIEVEKEVRI